MELPQIKYAPLFLLAIALISLSSVAQEQLDDPMAPTNIKNVIDSNGINMATFQPGHGGMYVSIGNESSGIKRDPGRARYLSDNHTGTITEIKITATSSGYTYGPPELSGFGAGTFLKVDAQGRSEVFKYVGGSYVDFQDTGGALTCGSSECTYTDRYGLVVTFDKSLSDNYTSCYGASINGQPCSGSASTKFKNIAMQTEAVLPDGERLTYTYRPIPGFTGTSRVYKSAAQSSLGWMIKYYYGSKNTWQSGSTYNSEVDRSVMAINTSVEYCNPGALHCYSLSNSWPMSEMYGHQSLTYPSNSTSNWISTITSDITNAFGQSDSYSKTRDDIGYHHGESYESYSGVTYSYYKPPCANYNGQCTSTSETGKVKRLSIGGTKYQFDYQPLYNESPDGEFLVDSSRAQLNSYTDNLGREYRYIYHDQWKKRIHKVVYPDATPSVSNPSGGYTEYLYDARGNVTQIKRYPKGGGTPLIKSATYLSSCSNIKVCNKPTSVTDENGVKRLFTYHAQSGNIATITWPSVNGDRAQIRYYYEQKTPKVRNSSGSLVNSTPVWKLTEVSKCMVGDLNSCAGTDQEHRTLYEYNHNNLLMSAKTERSGDGGVLLKSTMSYDIYGNLTAEDGPRSGTYDKKYYYYDALQRKIGEIGGDPDGSGPLKRQGVRTYYNADGKVTQVKSGVVSSVSLSALNSMYAQKKVVKDYESGSGLHIKDRIYAGSSLKRVVQKSYDPKMRLECEAVRLNPSTFGALPASACTLGTKGPDGNDRITKYTYDSTGALTSKVRAFGTPNQRVEKQNNYRADNGLLDSVEDGLGNTTFYDYDDFNRLEYTYYPTPSNGSVPSSTDYTKNTYTGANLTSKRLRNGSVVSYNYDAKGRVSSTAGAIYGSTDYNNFDQEVYRSSYETGGSLSEVEVEYNALGWKSSEKVHYGSSLISTVSYGYDDYGRKNRVTWPDGFYVTYDYGVSGYASDYVQHIKENGLTALVSYSYDSYGRVSTLSRSNGVITSYVYDDESRLELMSTDLSGSIDDIYEAFDYTIAGQLKTRDIDVNNSSYVYQPGSNSTINYGVNDLNQITTVNSSSVTYDANGNLKSRSGYAYTYQDNNLLTKVVKSGVTTNLVYDANKRLFHVAKSGVTTRFVHDGGRVIAETNTTGTVQNRYIHGLASDDPIVWYVGSGTSSKRYYTKNHQGSIIGGSYQSGGRAFINAYDEYGVNASGNTGRYRYTGQMWLHEVNLYYYKARMYDPSIGRFMQTDPIGYEDGMNWYAYAKNDPIGRSDPTGKYSIGRSWRDPYDQSWYTRPQTPCLIGRSCDSPIPLYKSNQGEGSEKKGNRSFRLPSLGEIVRNFFKQSRGESHNNFNVQQSDASVYPPRANCGAVTDCLVRIDQYEEAYRLDQSIGSDPRVEAVIEGIREMGKQYLCASKNPCDHMEYYERGLQPPPVWPPALTN